MCPHTHIHNVNDILCEVYLYIVYATCVSLKGAVSCVHRPGLLPSI
jgi:hypothetical protein